MASTTERIVEVGQYGGVTHYGLAGDAGRFDLAHVVVDREHSATVVAVYRDPESGRDDDAARDAIRAHVAGYATDVCEAGARLVIQWHPGRDRCEAEDVTP